MKIKPKDVGDFSILVSVLNGERVLARQLLMNETRKWRIRATGNWTITSIAYEAHTDVGHGIWTYHLPRPTKVRSGEWVSVKFDIRGLIETFYT